MKNESKAGRDLLRWFDRNRRQLPWREYRDPYPIWVSEIMLQQTQVSTVVPYFEAFLRRFPTVAALASADIDEVLALWSGLGYYRRARSLHAAARRVIELGGFPTTAAELVELPGIGPYTAAAVASMAYGEAAPVLDGNVERVLCRWLGIGEDPKRRAVRARLLEAGRGLLTRSRPGDGNQALMELGATVCLPRRPDCPCCPLRLACRGRRSGDPERFPVPRRRRKAEKVAWAVAIVERRGRILFLRRAEDEDLLSGLWELPNVAWEGSKEAAAAALGGKYGGTWCLGPKAGRVRHGITFRDVTVEAFVVSRSGRFRHPRSTIWIRPGERRELGLSSLFEKVLRVREAAGER